MLSASRRVRWMLVERGMNGVQAGGWVESGCNAKSKRIKAAAKDR